MTISEELQKKIDLLDKYDNAYHNGESIISDAAYDLFKDSVIRCLPHDHPMLDKVGHDTSDSWKKCQHIIFMGSQNKASDEGEITKWVDGVYSSLGVKDGEVEFVIEHKIDGFSLETVYIGSKLEAAVTRGNGVVGEDILDNACMFRHLPNKLSLEKQVVVRGEGVIFKDNYDLVQKETNDHFKNIRNAASGISRRLDGSYSKVINFIAYDVNAKVPTETDKIEVLKKLGFMTAPLTKVSTLEDILSVYRDYKNGKRDKLSYEIDGLVLKLNSVELQEQLGVTHNRPNGQIALKFDPDQAITTNKQIRVQVGRTGKLTPLAILEPVNLMGSTISKATLHNFAYIQTMMIGIGSEVTIEKKGDIIPQVVEVLTPGDPYVNPTECPSCGGPIKDDGVNLWCFNEGCREREVNRVLYWIKTLDIKGFSGKFVERLWDMGKVKSASDIYRITPDDLSGIEGIGEKTAIAFFEAREKTSSMYLDTFITALGIPGCSSGTSKDLVETFHNWDTIKTLRASDIESLPGYAEKSASQIVEGLRDIAGMAEELLEVIEIKEKKKGVLTGYSFCVTGSLVKYSRKQFKEVVEENGGVFKGSVVSGLTYLVTNDPNSGSSKNNKAEKLGVKLIDEKGFLSLIGEPELVEDSVNEDTPAESTVSKGVQLEYEPLF
jgi:DNA ligase (NAD+)